MPPTSEIHYAYGPSYAAAGSGASRGIGELLASWSAPGTVAVVVDPDVHSLGVSQPVVDAIEAAGFRVAVVACDKGEPQLSWVKRVVAEVRAAKPGACVGVGGGSAMDIAKLSAALVRNPGDVTEYVGAGRVRSASIPTVMVPTTAGTGSETTQVAMLSNSGKKVVVSSAPLIPRAAVLDPDLTIKLPRSVTAASGLDALAHGIEAYISTRANVLTMGASLTGAELIAASIAGAVDHPDDMGLRMGMLAGAYWSGIGLNANVVLGHSIAYTIANRTGLAHGVTCAMALPYCLAYNERGSTEKVDRIANRLRDQIGDRAPDAADPHGLYGWLVELSEHLGIPRSLQEVGIGKNDVAGMATECIESYPRPNNPVPFEPGELQELYGFMFHGDVLGCVKSFQSK